jgi:hypothetical protein
MFEQFLLEDHPVVMRQEISEHLKRLGPQRNHRPGLAQIIAQGIEDIVVKDIEHRPLKPSIVTWW